MYISSNSVGCGSRSYTSCLSWITCLVLLSDLFCHYCVGGPIVIWNVRISMGFRTMVKGSASSSFTFSDWNFRLLPAQQSAEEMVKTALSMNLGFVCKLLSECLNLSLSFTTLCVCEFVSRGAIPCFEPAPPCPACPRICHCSLLRSAKGKLAPRVSSVASVISKGSNSLCNKDDTAQFNNKSPYTLSPRDGIGNGMSVPKKLFCLTCRDTTAGWDKMASSPTS